MGVRHKVLLHVPLAVWRHITLRIQMRSFWHQRERCIHQAEVCGLDVMGAYTICWRFFRLVCLFSTARSVPLDSRFQGLQISVNEPLHSFTGHFTLVLVLPRQTTACNDHTPDAPAHLDQHAAIAALQVKHSNSNYPFNDSSLGDHHCALATSHLLLQHCQAVLLPSRQENPLPPQLRKCRHAHNDPELIAHCEDQLRIACEGHLQVAGPVCIGRHCFC
mmetsp:Transcript_121039/g.220081  ORF Transcript_121039/g.220081 Transcript_121039/m.220081 type:complete len:219 (+) Transcript_121039:324-980(+)